jgi:hypothetical protein
MYAKILLWRLEYSEQLLLQEQASQFLQENSRCFEVTLINTETTFACFATLR